MCKSEMVMLATATATATATTNRHQNDTSFYGPVYRVQDKFSRLSVNRDFEQVNSDCSHQIMINFLLIILLIINRKFINLTIIVRQCS